MVSRPISLASSARQRPIGGSTGRFGLPAREAPLVPCGWWPTGSRGKRRRRRDKARRAAKKGGHQIAKGTLAAAAWVILVTSLTPGGLLHRRCSCPLSPAMAHRTRRHTLEKPDRPEPAAGDRRALGQTLRAGSSSDHSSSRAAR